MIPTARTRQIAATVLALSSSIALAGPPFVTDDPEPVELHHWEINTAATGSWHGGQSSLGLPSVDINYGIAPDVQLHAQPRYAIERDGATHKGIDDTEIGIKYRFYERKADDTALMLGAYPMYQLATGARALGADRGTHGVFLPLWAQYDSGPWTVYGGWGYRISHAADGRSSVFTGTTVLRHIDDRLQLGVEVFHETPTTTGGRSTSGFNVGGASQVASGLSVLYSVGRSRAEAPRNLFYTGLQTRF